MRGGGFMTMPRLGDWVRIQYEGIVVGVATDGDLRVRPGECAHIVDTHVDWCEVLVTPVDVGDELNPAHAAGLGPYSTVAAIDGASFTLDGGVWCGTDGTRFRHIDELIAAWDGEPLTVLRVGGGAK